MAIPLQSRRLIVKALGIRFRAAKTIHVRIVLPAQSPIAVRAAGETGLSLGVHLAKRFTNETRAIYLIFLSAIITYLFQGNRHVRILFGSVARTSRDSLLPSFQVAKPENRGDCQTQEKTDYAASNCHANRDS